LLEWEIHRVGLPARDSETAAHDAQVVPPTAAQASAVQNFFSCSCPEAWIGGSDDYRPITCEAP
jgi:hypothetical protein